MSLEMLRLLYLEQARKITKPVMSDASKREWDLLIAQADHLEKRMQSGDGFKLKPANLTELEVPPGVAKLLREGNSVRYGVLRVGDKILEIVFSPIWATPYGSNEKPIGFEVSDVTFSQYDAGGKLLFSGDYFPIVLKEGK